jgi:hypothetical protein
MSNTLVRWAVRTLVAGCLIAGTVITGAGTSSADVVASVPPILGNGAGLNGQSWTFGAGR